MENIRKKVLVVDDDPQICRLLSQFLETEHALYEVIVAGNTHEALEVLSEENFSLVVADIHMPGISGIDLLSIIRGRYPQIKVILMTGYCTPEVREEVQKSGCLYFIEKPIQLRELRQLISSELAKEDEGGFGGTLKNIQLSDLIQMCCLSAVNTAISVRKGTQQGTIFIEDGEITHALCEKEQGEEAFYKILGWRSGSFETLGDIINPKTTIDKNWESLLLEGLHRVDELVAENAKIDEPPDNCQAIPEHKSLRVFVVDDSSMMRRILTDMLTSDKDICVVGTAKNGEEALKKIQELRPDIVTLDVNMPLIGGGTVLKHVMIKNPCPVVIVSSTYDDTQANTLDSLRFGAVDFISKPVKSRNMKEQQRRLIDKVKLAAKAKISNFRRVRSPKILSEETKSTDSQNPCDFLVVCSSGPGGYSELVKIIPRLPASLNACMIAVQRTPQSIILPLADYFSKRSRFNVLPMHDHVQITCGRCYIATYNFSMKLRTQKEISFIDMDDGISDNNAFDLFLNSIAEFFTGQVLVLLLSGAEVGSLDGLRNIQKRNGRIIAQQVTSCMVPNPLEKAIQSKVVDSEMPAEEIVRRIIYYSGAKEFPKK